MTRYDPIASRRRKGDRKASASLVERAVEAYDFSAALRGELGPRITLPEERIVPQSEPAPVAPPVPVVTIPEPIAPEREPEPVLFEQVAQMPEPVIEPESIIEPEPAFVAEPIFVPVADVQPDPEPAPAPFVSGAVQTIDRTQLAAGGYLIPDGPVTGLSEEFRIVKRQLLRTASGQDGSALRNAQRILVCSAHPGEGKTFCTVNLALSMAAEKDMEVLLIDADFAKQNIMGALGLTGGPGFMDALADPAIAVEDCVIRTDLPNLSVLPAGRQTNNDSEFLASARTEKVLDALTRGRPGRILLFDSPPVLAASPASVLATHVGQALMVVRADKTSESALKDAVGLLQGCQTVRLLLNGVKFSASGRRFGTYYGQGD